MHSRSKSGINKPKLEPATPGRTNPKKPEPVGPQRPEPDMPVASKKNQAVDRLSKADPQPRRMEDKENFASAQPRTPQREKSVGKKTGAASTQNSPSRSAKQPVSGTKSRTPDFKQTQKPENQKKELLKIEENPEAFTVQKAAKPLGDSGSKKPVAKPVQEKKGASPTPTSSRYSSRVEERVLKSPMRADPSPSFSKLKRSVIDTKSHAANMEDDEEAEEIDIDGDSLLDSLRAKCQAQYNPEKLTAQFLNIINNPMRRALTDLMPQSKCHTMKDGRNFMKVGEVDIFYDKVDIEEILNLSMRTKIGTSQN